VRVLTHDQFLEKLRSRVKAAGTQRALATAIGCSDQYLSDVLRKRRLPGPRICRALQMDAEIRFVESA
jgi:transcriptional regulator with XRE-family HTH domain